MIEEHDTTAQLLSEIRRNVYSTELFLVRYKPNLIYRAQINSADISKGAVSIPVDNETFGNISDIEEGMTCYIGSTVGGDDIGRVRVRSASAGVINVAPDSNIPYADNLYVTVKEFYEFWPVFPRAVLNTGTLTYTLYKDYDVLLDDNQNDDFDPIPVIGSHFAGHFDTHTGIYFTATGSYTVDESTIDTAVWVFPTGCSIHIFTGTVPGIVTFPSEGMYTVKCTIYASSGKSYSTYRHIALCGRDSGNYRTIKDWELDSLEGEWGVGWNCKIRVREQANEFSDGDLVMIFPENTYGGSRGLSVSSRRQQLVFVGYVHYAENQYDYEDAETMIFLKGITSYMQNKEMFSVEMTDTQGTPADWTFIRDLDINRAIAHYFRWHSTLYKMTDVRPITTPQGSYDENVIQIQKGEIFTNINNFLKQRVFGSFSSDSVGRCFAEVDLNMLTTGSRPASVLTLLDTDWLGTPTIIERIELPISNVLLGGESYVVGSTTETGTAYLSRAPGELQTYTGKSENVSGVSLSSNGQDEINRLSGLYFAKQNNRYPELTLDMAVDLRTIDITPQAFYNYNLDSGQRNARLELHKRIIPRRITRTLENFVLKTNIYFEFETSGPPGDTIIIPVTAPNGDTDCEDDPDNCNPPCENGCNEEPEGNNPTGGTVYVATADRIGRSENFLESSPTWYNCTDILTDILDFILDPFDPANSAYALTETGIYRCTNLASSSPSWSLSLSLADIRTEAGNSNLYFGNISASITEDGLFWVALYENNGVDTGGDIGCVRTDNHFSSWNYAVVATAGSGDTLGPRAQAQASNITAGRGYMAGLQNDRISGFFVTNDGNVTWFPVNGTGAFTEIHTIEVAYAGSETRWFTYRTPSAIMYSHDSFGSVNVGLNNPGPVTITNYPHRWIVVATFDADDVVAFLPELGTFRSTDGGITWNQTLSWTDSESASAVGFGRWPFDSSRCYLLTSSQIKYSTNFGSDFSSGSTNKLGNWNTVMGVNYSTPRNIVPVWVI